MNIDVVVDNAALIELVAVAGPDRDLMRRLRTAVAAAPELIDAEALSVLRRMERRSELTADQARTALRRVQEAPISRLTHRPLLARAWQLRDVLSTYDALYVALAEQLAVPLITCDAKLAGAHGHRAVVEWYPRS